jgi:hypothetical protein
VSREPQDTQGRNRYRFHPLASPPPPLRNAARIRPAAIAGLALALIGAVLVAFALLVVAGAP